MSFSDELIMRIRFLPGEAVVESFFDIIFLASEVVQISLSASSGVVIYKCFERRPGVKSWNKGIIVLLC